MGLHEAIQNLKQDKRMRSIMIKNGELTEADIQQQDSQAQDSADNAVSLDLENDSPADTVGNFAEDHVTPPPALEDDFTNHFN